MPANELSYFVGETVSLIDRGLYFTVQLELDRRSGAPGSKCFDGEVIVGYKSTSCGERAGQPTQI